MILYLDLIIALNFLVDYLLLIGTNRLIGYPSDHIKAAWAALLGSIYAAVCALPEFRFLGNGVWRLVFLILMGGIGFGWRWDALRKTAVYVLLNLALSGIAGGTDMKHFPGILICCFLLWLLCSVGFQSVAGTEQYVRAELHWKGKCVQLLALRDTGNTLRDPVTGEQILICGADVGEELLGISRDHFRDPVTAVMKIPGLRLIPYHSVGNQGGMMVAVRLEQSLIGGVPQKPLVAFAPEEIGRGACYRMLTGGTV